MTVYTLTKDVIGRSEVPGIVVSMDYNRFYLVHGSHAPPDRFRFIPFMSVVGLCDSGSASGVVPVVVDNDGVITLKEEVTWTEWSSYGHRCRG